MPGAITHHGHPAVYDVLVGLHVAAVVIGFGAVAVSGAYGAVGRHGGASKRQAEAIGELGRFFSSKAYAEFLILVGPILGMAAMAVRPAGQEFTELWAVGGETIWVVASGVLLAVVRPAERAIREAIGPGGGSRQLPADAVGVPARRLMWAAATTDLLFVVALLLMVTQPP